MKIDALRQANTISPLQTQRKQNAAENKQQRPHDEISISNGTRTLPDIAAKVTDQQRAREVVIKRYQDFVDKPVSISNQNILSALKNTMIT